MTELLNKTKQTIAKYNMLTVEDRVVVAFSGGPDSVALFHLLRSLKKELKLEIYLAHLNHMLRGKESDADAAFVRRIAGRYKVPVFVREENVRALAKKEKRSVEDAARKARYDFLLSTARQTGAKKIALGHQRDDQVETLLMRLIRGSGLRGLASIPPARRVGNRLIIRPLIEVSRKEIISYLNQRRIKYRIDSSNLKTDYLRNRVRIKLLPLLEKEYNPNIRQTLFHLAEILRVNYEYIQTLARKGYRDCLKLKEKNAISLSLSRIKRYPPALQSEIIRLAIEQLNGKIDYKHWQDIEGLLSNKPTGSVIHLPARLRAEKGYREIVFYRAGGGKLPPRQERETTLLPQGLAKDKIREIKIPGVTAIQELGLKIKTGLFKGGDSTHLARACRGQIYSTRGLDTLTGTGKSNPYGNVEFKLGHRRNEECVDFKKIKLPLRVRFRKPGDWFRPLGMKQKKKIKDFFIDEKIPYSLRSTIPLLVSGRDEIVWVLGLRVSEDFKITKNTRKILKIKITTSKL